VASNSDKIAIALNRPAKALGLKLGDLLFQPEIAQKVREHQVVVFPSNYEMYGHISADMHAAIGSFVQDIEIASIDEAFLDFTGYDHLNLREYGLEIIRTIRNGKWLPIALGIAPTKTLAKVANKLAKKDPASRGLMLIASDEEREAALKKLPLGDVWGIGSRFRRRIENELYRENLTAWDFASMPRKRVRKLFGVVGERTWMELHGIQCYDFELGGPPDKERIMTSRMLTTPLTEQDEVLSALMHHLATSARKLRRQNSYAQTMYVFFMTSQHPDYKRPRLVRSLELRFPSPLKTTAEMIPYLTKMVAAMWPQCRPGQEKYRFNKAGVMLGEITSDYAMQPTLYEDVTRRRKMQNMQDAVDEINGDAPADKRTVLFGPEFAHKDKTTFVRQGLTDNPRALWSQRHKIRNT
jgi:DNA polymerase V